MENIIAGTTVHFNSVEIRSSNGQILMNQESCISEIQNLKLAKILTFKEFRGIPAEYAQAAFSTVPDVLIHVALLTHYTETRSIQEKRWVETLREVMTCETSVFGLKYIHTLSAQIEVVV